MNEEQQKRYEALEAEKQALNPNNADDRFRQTVIEQEQAQIKAQHESEDRLQRQAAEVAEIQLPEDYDLRWGVVGANEEVRSLLRQIKEFQFSQHNDELAKLQAEHTDRIRLIEESKAELIDQVAALESKLEDSDAKVIRAVNEKLVAQEQLIDVESKRDNAVVAKEEAEADRDKARSEVMSLKGQIDELEGMLRTYRSRTSGGAGGGLVLTSTLKPETEEERIARLEQERLDQLNKSLARIGHAPLQFPTSPAEAEAAAATEDERFPVDEDAHDAGRLDEGDKAVEVAGEVPSLEARVTELEEWKNSVEERIAGLTFQR
jgi:hypothetical protein